MDGFKKVDKHQIISIQADENIYYSLVSPLLKQFLLWYTELEF